MTHMKTEHKSNKDVIIIQTLYSRGNIIARNADFDFGFGTRNETDTFKYETLNNNSEKYF